MCPDGYEAKGLEFSSNGLKVRVSGGTIGPCSISGVKDSRWSLPSHRLDSGKLSQRQNIHEGRAASYDGALQSKHVPLKSIYIMISVSLSCSVTAALHSGDITTTTRRCRISGIPHGNPTKRAGEMDQTHRDQPSISTARMTVNNQETRLATVKCG